MPHSPLKPAQVRPWASLSPLASKRRQLDGFGAESHRCHGDDLAATPASPLAARFCQASSSAAEDQSHGGDDEGRALPTTPAAPPTATAAHAHARARTPTAPLLPMAPARTLTAFVPTPATAKRRWLDGSGPEDEDRPTTQRRRLILRPPRPPPPPAPLQAGSGDDGRASSLALRDMDAAFQDCLRMSPLDHQAEAAFQPKPSPGLQVPSPLLTGSTTSLAGLAPLPPAGSDPSAGMRASLAVIEAESQAARMAHAEQEQRDKATAKTYARHVTKYQDWWKRDQEQRMKTTPGWTEIPALPITAAKAALFLDYEAKREKVCLPSPSSLLWLLSTEQGETEKGGAQVHHSQLKCWQGGNLTGDICP